MWRVRPAPLAVPTPPEVPITAVPPAALSHPSSSSSSSASPSPPESQDRSPTSLQPVPITLGTTPTLTRAAHAVVQARAIFERIRDLTQQQYKLKAELKVLHGFDDSETYVQPFSRPCPAPLPGPSARPLCPPPLLAPLPAPSARPLCPP